MSTPSEFAPVPARDPSGTVLVLSERAMFRRTFAAIVRSFGRRCEAGAAPEGHVDDPVALAIADAGALDPEAATAHLAGVRAALRGVDVAVVIDQLDDAVVEALMGAGAAGVLVKASPPAVLTDSLGVLLAGERCRPAPTVRIPAEGLPAAVRARLTAREQKMLRLAAGGASVPAVAAELSLTPAKVVSDLRRIMDVVRGRA